MTLLVQICVVVVTLAIVAIGVATIRTMLQLTRSATRLSTAAQFSMDQLERTLRETQELLVAAREIGAPAKRVVGRFQRLGERAADLSTALLDEIEDPIYTAVAVSRGVRTGTARLLELLASRVALHYSVHNGDDGHE